MQSTLVFGASDRSKEWSAFDVSKGARTIDEIEKCSKLSKAKCFSCCEIPIFKFVPIDHVIIDTLHLFLRVSDLLDLRITSSAWYSKGYSWQGKAVMSHHMKLFWTVFAKYTLGGTHHRKQWRDLTGPEKIRLFKNINIPKVFPALPNAAVLQDIWII